MHQVGGGFKNHQTITDPTTTDTGNEKPKARSQALDSVGHQHWSDLTTAAKQHQPIQLRPQPTPAPPDLDNTSPQLRAIRVTCPDPDYSRPRPTTRHVAEHRTPNAERREHCRALSMLPGACYARAPRPPPEPVAHEA
jgi:hypothetical protein